MAHALFSVRNSFSLGAFNTVINDAAELEALSGADALERDCYVYRAYIALGSHQARRRGWRAARQCQRARARTHHAGRARMR